jgi:HK97 family phage major capsid protein
MNLKDKRHTLLLEAKAITETAIEAKRSLTKTEQERVDAIRDQVKKIDQDLDVIKRVGELEGKAEMGTKQGKHELWGKQFLKELEVYPTAKKDLIPVAGSVTVGSMSATIGEVEDIAETILQVIPIEQTTQDKISYLRETVRTHAAASVPVGTQKPTSTYNLERVNEDVVTIAHLTDPIPRQWLNDAPMLSRYLGKVMREGLLLDIERQIFAGDGADDEFTGLANVSGLLGQAFSTDILTTTRKAITVLELLPVRPDGWAIHPNDWEEFELLENTAGNLAMGAPGEIPVNRAERKLWGLPVLVTPNVTENTAYLGAFKTALKLWEREGVKIDWSETFNVTSGQDTFTGFESNQVKFRCEGRFQLEVARPGAVVEVSLISS